MLNYLPGFIDSVKQMSTEVAASAEDIAEVMSIAGQLGIENAYYVDGFQYKEN